MQIESQEVERQKAEMEVRVKAWSTGPAGPAGTTHLARQPKARVETARPHATIMTPPLSMALPESLNATCPTSHRAIPQKVGWAPIRGAVLYVRLCRLRIQSISHCLPQKVVEVM